MARVRITIEYNMDHDGVPTADELRQERLDWLEGRIDIQDVVELDGSAGITIALV